MLGTKRGNRLEQCVSDYVVFDLETTGISYKTDQVIEISAVKVRNNEVIDEFTTLVNPGRPIPYGASRVNGITDAMVQEAPVFSEVLPQFLEFVADMLLAGHNIHTFDMKFLYRDCETFFGKLPDNDYIDTLPFAKLCLPELHHYKLTDLAEYYGIAADHAHRALQDCRMNQQVYEQLKKKWEEMKNSGQAPRICPRCGQVLVKRNGKYGPFTGCSGFPKCRYTESA